ncbi:uncharacterized protein LOC125804926 [Astyanax mexicanus]|uniref:uncharacterized protein LOC125804926 n=1 Tax=Astyanax mexicanus TaxID=7994 RepID=UPI0020CB104F|nr:uncharacterized protein LOC125804926 [Astyanax mexicanus]
MYSGKGACYTPRCTTEVSVKTTTKTCHHLKPIFHCGVAWHHHRRHTKRWKLPWRKERSQKTGGNIDQVDPQAAKEVEETQVLDLQIVPESGVLAEVHAVTLEVLYTPIVENTPEEMEEVLQTSTSLRDEVEKNCEQLLVNDADVIIEVLEVLEDDVVTVSVEPVGDQVIIIVDEAGINKQETTAGLVVELLKEVERVNGRPIDFKAGIQILPADDIDEDADDRATEQLVSIISEIEKIKLAELHPLASIQ